MGACANAAAWVESRLRQGVTAFVIINDRLGTMLELEAKDAGDIRSDQV